MSFTGSSQNPETGAQNTTSVYDGGVSAMNPTDLMVQEALKRGFTLDEINVVSLGTGEFNPNDEIEDEVAQKELFWPMNNQEQLGMESIPYKQIREVHEKMENELKNNYVRIQTELSENDDKIPFNQNQSDSLIKMGRLACTTIYQ